VTALPTIIRWISLVPSKMVKILEYVTVYAGQRPVGPVVSARIQHGLFEGNDGFRPTRVRFERGSDACREGTVNLAVSVGRTQTLHGANGAIMRTQLVAAHHLLSDPEARYKDLGPGYYERKADIRRRARSHVRGLERLGYKVTIEAVDPGTGELLPAAAEL
jgi:hypothetical protein